MPSGCIMGKCYICDELIWEDQMADVTFIGDKMACKDCIGKIQNRHSKGYVENLIELEKQRHKAEMIYLNNLMKLF